MDQQSGSASSHEDSGFQLVSFVVWGLFFSMKLVGFVSKAIKLLLTELVGQCRHILPLAFSALTSLRSVNAEKAAGNVFLHRLPTQLIRVYYCLTKISTRPAVKFHAYFIRLPSPLLF